MLTVSQRDLYQYGTAAYDDDPLGRDLFDLHDGDADAAHRDIEDRRAQISERLHSGASAVLTVRRMNAMLTSKLITAYRILVVYSWKMLTILFVYFVKVLQ